MFYKFACLASDTKFIVRDAANAIGISNRLDLIIENQDWEGMENLVLELLEKKDDEKAQNLLLIMIQLWGKQHLLLIHYFLDGSYRTLLHAAMYHKNHDAAMKSIEVGGRDIVVKDRHNTLLSYLFRCSYPKKILTELLLKLIETGGKDVLQCKDINGLLSAIEESLLEAGSSAENNRVRREGCS